jgi:putative transposase
LKGFLKSVACPPTSAAIKPGHPQQNGRHERMHLTLKKEATKPAGRNFLQQQARFEKFIEVFNNQRPTELWT